MLFPLWVLGKAIDKGEMAQQRDLDGLERPFIRPEVYTRLTRSRPNLTRPHWKRPSLIYHIILTVPALIRPYRNV